MNDELRIQSWGRSVWDYLLPFLRLPAPMRAPESEMIFCRVPDLESDLTRSTEDTSTGTPWTRRIGREEDVTRASSCSSTSESDLSSRSITTGRG
jgi:hypothetical protein